MSCFRWLLFPLAVVYDGITTVRNKLFDLGILEERRYPCPTIAVGNLAVGGTGKTPHVEYLLRLLSEGRRVATLSRGYGRRTRGFREAMLGSHPDDVGDEPLQMKRRFPQATIVVDADRREGMARLLQEEVQLVIMDDAFQHRYVQPDCRILLTDYAHRYTQDFLLPMGRLRESRRGARRADIIIVTKCPPTLSDAEQAAIISELSPREGQHIFFTYNIYGVPQPLFPDAPPYAETQEVSVITGIARPEPLVAHFAQRAKVHPLRFPDHHRFTATDIARIEAQLLSTPQAITTEKDATRLLPYASQLSLEARRRLYVQPIEVGFLANEFSFQQIIYRYVSTD